MKLLRKILFPFAILYGMVVYVRNKFFDCGLLTSKSYDFPVICVGNISVGGTGKSPMVEYLINLLQGENKVATLSRGYKRKTKGFQLVGRNAKSEEVGDEPLQFKTKFPDALVTVDEDRQNGIANLLNFKHPPNIIVLDDAFQHRKVTPGLAILLTAYDDLYADDFLLPMGNLRESRRGANRADIIVVTKCPADISETQRLKIQKKLKLKSKQSLYFSAIAYNEKVLNFKFSKNLKELGAFTLVTGIAKPKPLVAHLKGLGLDFEHLAFSDHHHFSQFELSRLNQSAILVTTEKDYMRLRGKLPAEKLYYLPIGVQFIEGENAFRQEINAFISQ